MEIYEFKLNGQRSWFYKKLSWIKNYLKTLFDIKKKDLDKLNHLLIPWNSFFKDEFLTSNWTKVLIEIEGFNLK